MSTQAANIEQGFTLRRRNLSVVRASVNLDVWTVDMVAATETPAIQWIPDPAGSGDYIEADEILGMDGVDFSRAPGMPFGDTHDLTSIDNVLGTITSLTIDGTRLLATALFRESKLQILKEMAAGHLPQVSVGYCVHEYEILARTDGINRPLVRAKRWTPHEISSVPVGADPNAVIRSGRKQTTFPDPAYSGLIKSLNPKEKKMADTETLLTEAEEAFAAADVALAALADVAEDGASDEIRARLAKLRARAEEDETANTDTPAETESETEEDKKAEEAARSIAKKRGKEAEAFFNSLVGLKRGKELKTLLGDFIAARAIAQVSAPVAHVVPVIDKPTAAQRSADIAKELDHTKLFAQRKRGYVAPK